MIDSHCHLDFEPLLSNLDKVIQRSKDIGIKKILTICTTIDSFVKIKEIVKRDEIIFGTYGIHPHEVKNNKIDTAEIIKEIKNNNKIIGIGETGLDFFYNHSEKSIQIKSFEDHIEAALELKIPLIIHCRNAEKETLDIFNYYKDANLKILMHCYTGSKEFAKRLFDFNTYFSASGIITFKNSKELQETFKSIPLDRLLIETDSPYLAPEPHRGKKNEPSFVVHTAEKLATLKRISNIDLINKTSLNFENLFN
ncbi:TatD family hydrolase [Candidatus Pelagibacter sp.]|nr:TatD family hydrolase [Candidatus Pelagibacter sp.]